MVGQPAGLGGRPHLTHTPRRHRHSTHTYRRTSTPNTHVSETPTLDIHTPRKVSTLNMYASEVPTPNPYASETPTLDTRDRMTQTVPPNDRIVSQVARTFLRGRVGWGSPEGTRKRVETRYGGKVRVRHVKHKANVTNTGNPRSSKEALESPRSMPTLECPSPGPRSWKGRPKDSTLTPTGRPGVHVSETGISNTR